MARFAVVAGLLLSTLAGRAHAQDAADEPAIGHQTDWVDDVVECLAWEESRDTPSAYNARSGAAGSLQFLYGTWMTTPQGRAGYSRYDPYASRQAARWMINAGRLHEWSTWRMCA